MENNYNCSNDFDTDFLLVNKSKYNKIVTKQENANKNPIEELDVYKMRILEYTKQKLISGIRDWLDGVLTTNQIKLLKILGFKYIAYEHTHPHPLSKNMLKRKQTWLRFFGLLIKKMSNNFFRGIRHHLNYLIY